MYQLSKGDRERVLAMAAGQRNDARRDAMEARVQAELPPVPGLADARSESERHAVYGAVIEQQRTRFIAAHGSAFACDEIDVGLKAPVAAREVVQTIVCNTVKAA